MAIIQDLPLELLNRIIELVGINKYAKESVAYLCAVSLVARAWRPIAQARLLLDAKLSNPAQLERYLAALERFSWRPTIDRLELSADCAGIFNALEKIAERVNIICLMLNGFSPTDASKADWNFLYRRQVEFLELEGGPEEQVVGTVSLSATRHLPLKKLELYFPFDSSIGFLTPLLGAALNLTHLTLSGSPNFTNGGGVLSSSDKRHWLDLAARLRVLELIFPDDPSTDPPDTMTLSTFLSACTSLRKFKIKLHPSECDALGTYLDLLPSKLEVLGTDLTTICHSPFDVAPRGLRRAMRASSLEDLKRWELFGTVHLEELEAGGEWWIMQCAKLGIEILTGTY